MQDIPEHLKHLGYTILADLIERSGVVAEHLQTRGPFTVFAPTDTAFKKFIGERGEEYNDKILGDQNLLQYILLQHVVQDKLKSNRLIDDMEVKTVANNYLRILNTKDGLTVNGAKINPGMMNQMAVNGIIHGISDVISGIDTNNAILIGNERGLSENATASRILSG